MTRECTVDGVVYEAHPANPYSAETCSGCEGFKKGKENLCPFLHQQANSQALESCTSGGKLIIWKVKNEQR